LTFCKVYIYFHKVYNYSKVSKTGDGMKKYEQAMEYIEKNVLPGMETGCKLPPENKLAHDAGVCVITLRRAIEELCLQGVLSRLPEHRAILAPRSRNELLGNNRIAICRLADEMYFSELLVNLQQALIETGRYLPKIYNLYSIQTGRYEGKDLLDDIVECVQACKAKAVVVLPASEDLSKTEACLSRQGIPLLGLLDYKPCQNRIERDFASGVYQGLVYMMQSGCRNIYYVGIRCDYYRERTAGARQFFKDMYHNESPDKRIIPAFGTVDEGFRAFNALYDIDPTVDGICAHNDLCAEGIIMAAKKHRIMVPEQLSVIGFDNLSRSKNMVPSLTSISVPSNVFVTETVRALDYMLANGVNASVRVILQHHLNIRASVKGASRQ